MWRSHRLGCPTALFNLAALTAPEGRPFWLQRFAFHFRSTPSSPTAARTSVGSAVPEGAIWHPMPAGVDPAAGGTGPPPPPLPDVVGQLSLVAVGAPENRGGPTRSNSGGTQPLALLGGGHPLEGQFSLTGIQDVISTVPGSHFHKVGQSASVTHVVGSAGGMHAVVA